MKHSHEILSERIANQFFWVLVYFFSFLDLTVREIIDLKKLLRVYNLFSIVYEVLMVLQLDFKGPYHNVRMHL